MKAKDTELVHKTVAELFDMVKEQQKKIDEALAEIGRAMKCCESIETECVLTEIKGILE